MLKQTVQATTFFSYKFILHFQNFIKHACLALNEKDDHSFQFIITVNNMQDSELTTLKSLTVGPNTKSCALYKAVFL